MLPLDTIVGNSAAVGYLRHMKQTGRIHHTLLFHGPDGVGKSSCAIAFAKELGIQPSDIQEYVPEGKGYLHTIDTMSDIKKASMEHPFESPKKLILIREADRMLPSGANALLKTLEEPLETTLIIMTTSNLEGMLETIQSRSCHIAFRRLNHVEITTLLQKHGVEGEDAKKAVSIGQGSISKALRYEMGQKREATVFSALTSMIEGNPTLCIDLLSELEEEDPEDLFESILQWFRDLHLLKSGGKKELLFNAKQVDRLEAILQHQIPSLDQVVEIVQGGHTALKHNVKLRSIVEGMICRFISDNRLIACD